MYIDTFSPNHSFLKMFVDLNNYIIIIFIDIGIRVVMFPCSLTEQVFELGHIQMY